MQAWEAQLRLKVLRLERQLAEAHKADERIKSAFRAGYHCTWNIDRAEFCFDPAMSPGDPDGAYEAWRAISEKNGSLPPCPRQSSSADPSGN
jgi:hypothetical protein